MQGFILKSFFGLHHAEDINKRQRGMKVLKISKALKRQIIEKRKILS